MSTGDTTSEYSHNIGFYLAGNNNVTAAIDTVENGGDGATGLVFATSSSTAVDPSERLRITADGKVGIGTTSPTQRLQVTDGSLSNFYVAPGYNSGAGTLLATGGSEYLAFATNGLANERAMDRDWETRE